MNRIHVLSPGLQTTVQDLGRPGYAHWGVSASGAADALSLRLGNRLAGNPDGAPALEMTLLGGTFLFDRAAHVAVTGSDLGIPSGRAFEVAAGETLRFGPARNGARCYLCVRGGIDAPRVLGSASAHVQSGLGHVVRKGDILDIGSLASAPPWPRPVPPYPCEKVLRVTQGPQWQWFETGLDGEYVVSETSNRMGLRLHGKPLRYTGEMLTEGVSLGAVQITPNGQPIILFVEHQTTGGYPKIANVILADMHIVGQLRPRDAIRFEPVSFEDALEALRRQEQWLRSVTS